VRVVATDVGVKDEVEDADKEVREAKEHGIVREAFGAARATPSMTAIAASITSRTPPSSTLRLLVSQL
jgi:hypothetical protein